MVNKISIGSIVRSFLRFGLILILQGFHPRYKKRNKGIQDKFVIGVEAIQKAWLCSTKEILQCSTT